ncbi:MAG: DUF1320 family protein [Ignavibacteriaceae bacterium]|nr:DUF1320 family protein [Ignavibacteriaceae bacterium]
MSGEPAPELQPINSSNVLSVLSEQKVISLLNYTNELSFDLSDPEDPVSVILANLVTASIGFVTGFIARNPALISNSFIKALNLHIAVYYIFTFNPETPVPESVKSNFNMAVSTLMQISNGSLSLTTADTNLLLTAYTQESFLNY